MTGFPNDQSNPLGAIPVYVVTGGGGAVTASSASVTLVANVAQQAAASNTLRRYLFIQCITAEVDVWVNIAGAPAAIGAADSFLLAAGASYESGTNVVGNAVSIISAANAVVTVLEG